MRSPAAPPAPCGPPHLEHHAAAGRPRRAQVHVAAGNLPALLRTPARPATRLQPLVGGGLLGRRLLGRLLLRGRPLRLLRRPRPAPPGPGTCGTPAPAGRARAVPPSVPRTADRDDRPPPASAARTTNPPRRRTAPRPASRRNRRAAVGALVESNESALGSTPRCCGLQWHRQTTRVHVCSLSSRLRATLGPRFAGLTALTTAPRTLLQTGSRRPAAATALVQHALVRARRRTAPAARPASHLERDADARRPRRAQVHVAARRRRRPIPHP